MWLPICQTMWLPNQIWMTIWLSICQTVVLHPLGETDGWDDKHGHDDRGEDEEDDGRAFGQVR